jgi:hypothetical protein
MTGTEIAAISGAVAILASVVSNFLPNDPKNKWVKILDAIISICAINANVKGMMNKDKQLPLLPKEKKKKPLFFPMALILIVLISYGCTKNQDVIHDGFLITHEVITQTKIISDNLCERAVLSQEDCDKIKAIYASIDILYPEIHELCNDMFHAQEQDNYEEYVMKYLAKLSEYNRMYFELINIISSVEW